MGRRSRRRGGSSESDPALKQEAMRSRSAWLTYPRKDPRSRSGVVAGLLWLQVDEQVAECASLWPPLAAIEVEHTFYLHSRVDEAAVFASQCRLGEGSRPPITRRRRSRWNKRVGLPRKELGGARSGFCRLKGKLLSLSPTYVQSNQRAIGLIHLRSLTLRASTFLDCRCPQRLADQYESLAGLYAGNPKDATIVLRRM